MGGVLEREYQTSKIEKENSTGFYSRVYIYIYTYTRVNYKDKEK